MQIIKPSENKFGFTLAEVLITLVIIGVVAAMTIPSVVDGTQKQEHVTSLKKAYSVLQQSLYRISDNNGYPRGDYSFFNDENFLDEFAKVTHVIKKCNNTTDCFRNANTIYKTLNNGGVSITSGKSVITADGIMYTFAPSISTIYGLSQEDNDNLLGRIFVDTNGYKGPNKYGIDAYFFYLIDDKGIIPAGTASTADCKNSSAGGSCAAKVLREGKINY